MVTSSAENQLSLVYKRILEITCDIADAEVSCIFMVDPLSGALSPVAVQTATNDANGRKLKKSEERIQARVTPAPFSKMETSLEPREKKKKKEKKSVTVPADGRFSRGILAS